MAKQKALEYETKCDFEFRDDGTKGHYIIWADKVETTCRRCKKQHEVSDKFAEKARANNDLLENALCLDCYIAEKKLEKEVETSEKNNSYSKRAGIGQATNLFILSGGKSPKDFGTEKEILEKVAEWHELTELIQENG